MLNSQLHLPFFSIARTSLLSYSVVRKRQSLIEADIMPNNPNARDDSPLKDYEFTARKTRGTALPRSRLEDQTIFICFDLLQSALQIN